MTKILDQLIGQINEAMKDRDSVRVSTLRMLLSELKNVKIDKPDMKEADELAVVRKEVKKRMDAIEAYEKAGRVELADQEKKEMQILKEYLPKDLSDQELYKLVDEVIAETGVSAVSQMGEVIGQVIKKSQGRADGARVAALVKEKLT